MRALMHLLSFSILLQLVTSLQPTKKERRPYPRPSSTTLKPGSTGVPSIVPTAASGGGLEFYKEVHVGVLNVSGWDLYFDGLLRAGAVNFMLDGYMVRNNEILKWLHRDWDKSRFMSLKKRVQAKGGKILATLYDNLDHNYQYDIDRDIFLSNARKFLQAYPVDGFCLTYGGSSEEQVFYIRELITAFQELGKISMTKYSHFTWNEALGIGIPRLTDVNLVALEPNYGASDAERGLFITDATAGKAIRDATKAGVQREKLILGIPLLAVAYDKSPDPTRYSRVITEFGADPQGDGTVYGPDGRLYYFYSLTRAIGKVRLARK